MIALSESGTIIAFLVGVSQEFAEEAVRHVSRTIARQSAEQFSAAPLDSDILMERVCCDLGIAYHDTLKTPTDVLLAYLVDCGASVVDYQIVTVDEVNNRGHHQ